MHAPACLWYHVQGSLSVGEPRSLPHLEFLPTFYFLHFSCRLEFALGGKPTESFLLFLSPAKCIPDYHAVCARNHSGPVVEGWFRLWRRMHRPSSNRPTCSAYLCSQLSATANHPDWHTLLPSQCHNSYCNPYLHFHEGLLCRDVHHYAFGKFTIV